MLSLRGTEQPAIIAGCFAFGDRTVAYFTMNQVGRRADIL